MVKLKVRATFFNLKWRNSKSVFLVDSAELGPRPAIICAQLKSEVVATAEIAAYMGPTVGRIGPVLPVNFRLVDESIGLWRRLERWNQEGWRRAGVSK